jgi:hypothetical protein
MKVSIISILLSIGFFGFSVYKIWKLVELLRKRSASSTWPVIAGEVVSKKVAESRSTRGGTSYFPELTYKYSVMGMEFQKETRISGMYSRKSAEDAVYNMGNSIELRYNPQNPKEHTSKLDKINVWDIVLIFVNLALAIFLLVPLFL